MDHLISRSMRGCAGREPERGNEVLEGRGAVIVFAMIGPATAMAELVACRESGDLFVKVADHRHADIRRHERPNTAELSAPS